MHTLPPNDKKLLEQLDAEDVPYLSHQSLFCDARLHHQDHRFQRSYSSFYTDFIIVLFPSDTLPTAGSFRTN